MDFSIKPMKPNMYDRPSKPNRPARIVGLCILSALFLLVIGLLVWYFGFYPFRAGKVNNILLGSDEQRVEKVLGKADAQDDFHWEYYDDSYMKLYRKTEEKTVELLNAVGMEEIEQLTEEVTELSEQLFNLEYKYICVTFDGEKRVSEVLFDAKRCDNNLLSKKWDVAYSLPKDPSVGDYWDYLVAQFRSENHIKIKDVPAFYNLTDNRLSAQIYYNDGSYKCVYVPAEAFSDVQTYVAGEHTISWQDDWGNYSGTLTVLEKIEKGTTLSGTLESGVQYELIALEKGTLQEKPPFSLSLYGNGAVAGTLAWKTNNLSSAVTKLSIGEGITDIERDAFRNFHALETVDLHSPHYVFQDNALYNSAKTRLLAVAATAQENFSVPAGVIETDNVFSDSPRLRSFSSGETLMALPEGAFSNCTALTEVQLTNTIVSIGAYAFYNCSSLTVIRLPDSLQNIEKGLFNNCSALQEIQLPSSLRTIAAEAFCNCASLTELFIPASVSEISNYAFAADPEYGFPDGSVGWTILGLYSYDPEFVNGLQKISVDENNRYFCTIDGVLFSKDMSTLLYYPQQKAGTEYTVPDNVTTIGTAAFYGNSNLQTVHFSESVQTIRLYAFAHSKVSDVTLPSRLNFIQPYAFAYCPNLTSITIPASVEFIGSRAFFSTIYSSDIADELGITIYSPVPGSGSVLSDIYLNTAEIPSGWSDYWNQGTKATVHLREG